MRRSTWSLKPMYLKTSAEVSGDRSGWIPNEMCPPPADEPVTISCTVCGRPIYEPELAWLVWKPDLSALHLAHKGGCLDEVEKQFGSCVPSWELWWIVQGDPMNDLEIGLDQFKTPLERLVCFLGHLLNYYVGKPPQNLWEIIAGFLNATQKTGEPNL